jgi:hypothetical protein
VTYPATPGASSMPTSATPTSGASPPGGGSSEAHPHPQLELLLENNRVDMAAIAQAQKEGRIPDRFAAVEILTIVLSIAAMWMSQAPELTGVIRLVSPARRRAVVVGAVKAILAL